MIALVVLIAGAATWICYHNRCARSPRKLRHAETVSVPYAPTRSDMLPGLSDPFWVTLFHKMLATAALVVAVSMLVERVGPFLAHRAG